MEDLGTEVKGELLPGKLLVVRSSRKFARVGAMVSDPEGLTPHSAPAQSRRHVGQDGLDDVGVVIDAELVGHGQEQRVGLGDGLVLGQLLDEDVGLGGVAAAENGPPLRLDVAEVVRVLGTAEVGAVAVVDEGEDAAADRNARASLMTGGGPRGAIGAATRAEPRSKAPPPEPAPSETTSPASSWM